MDCNICGRRNCFGCFDSLTGTPIFTCNKMISEYSLSDTEIIKEKLYMNSVSDWAIAERYMDSIKKHNEFYLNKNILLLLKGK